MQLLSDETSSGNIHQEEVSGRLLAHRALLRALARKVFSHEGHHLSTRELILLQTLCMGDESAEPCRIAAMDEIDRIFDNSQH